MREKLFYDIETLKYHTVIVFMNEDKEVIKIMHNDFAGLKDIIDNHILIGYNNVFFDDKILTLIMNGIRKPEAIQRYSQRIIFDDYKMYADRSIKSFDVFKALSPDKPSLKKVEANLGLKIVESAIPFDIDRELSQDELQELIDYCIYDVASTIDSFNQVTDRSGNIVRDTFEIKKMLIDLVGEGKHHYGNSFFIDKMYPLPDKWISHRIPAELINDIENEEVRNFFKTLGKELVIDYLDNKITFAKGGLHSVSNELTGKLLDDVIILDVGGMYAKTLINYKILGDKTKEFEEMVEHRNVLKAQKDPKQLAYKLVQNSTFGVMGFQYSTLYDEYRKDTTCYIGQALLIIFAEMLYNIGCKIVQCNTDGVAFQIGSATLEDVEHVKQVWEKKYDYILEYEYYDKFVQKDVNSYVAIEKDTQKIKAKGSFVNNYQGNVYYSANTTAIVDLMLVNKFMFDIPFHETIIQYKDNLILFQIITSITRKFSHVVDNEGNIYQKVNRVFATTTGMTSLKKVKIVDDEERYTKFPKLPKTFTICNEELKDVTLDNLDFNYYVEIAEQRYKDFQLLK